MPVGTFKVNTWKVKINPDTVVINMCGYHFMGNHSIIAWIAHPLCFVQNGFQQLGAYPQACRYLRNWDRAQSGIVCDEGVIHGIANAENCFYNILPLLCNGFIIVLVCS